MAALVAAGGVKMDVLVTGGGGLLGRQLVQALLERGDSVRVLLMPGEDASWIDGRPVAVHRGDIRDARSLEAAVRGAEGVLHLAGMMGTWKPLSDYRAVNVRGAENVCRAALAEGVRRVVHVSSWTVYGMGIGMPCHEDFPLAPFDEPYAVSKAEGDRLVQRMIANDGLPAVIIRPGTFFGPGDQLHFGRMADRLRAGRAIVVGTGDNALPFVYVTDVVQGLLLALDHDRAVGEAFNISNDQPLTQQEVLDAMADAIGARPARAHLPYSVLYAAGAAIERAATAARLQAQPPLTRLGVKLFGTDNRHSIDKARLELGYAPKVDIRDGIALAAEWYTTVPQAARRGLARWRG
jgi:nucleoside-diphosphate-sugar epimerase